MSEGRYRTRHEIDVAAPADDVFALIADAPSWPQVFPPTVHIERFDVREVGGTVHERLRLWATAGDEVRHWVSRREVDRAAGTVSFRQEVSQPPIAGMGGVWRVGAGPAGTTKLVLDHDFDVVDDDPQGLAWIQAAVDRNSGAELAALRRAAELATHPEDLALTFTDTIEIAGSVDDVYDFIYQADHWPTRLDHVARVELGEPEPGIQRLEMDTHAIDGSVHTTVSFRLGFPPGRILYKQTVLPKLLTAHVGEWLLEPVPDGVRASSRHSIRIDPTAVTGVLGATATVAEAREFVQRALSTNSLRTLDRARSFAEQRAAGWVPTAT
nr:aromatase/cyclase [Protofrankia symbiont of Coriaria ruscifolia]